MSNSVSICTSAVGQILPAMQRERGCVLQLTQTEIEGQSGRSPYNIASQWCLYLAIRHEHYLKMNLLHDIQESIIREGSNISSIFLKLQLLAARTGSTDLEDWVRYESEGYPSDAEVPEYRQIPVIYKGEFSGPFGSGIRNAPIPSYLIEKFAGKKWSDYQLRQSIASIDDLISSSAKKRGGSLGIDVSNLMLLLQGKIYPDYACNQVTGEISRTSLVEIQHTVRSRILELTIQLEKNVPGIENVTLGRGDSGNSETSNKISQLSQQIIYGDVTTINSSGHGSNISVDSSSGNTDIFVKSLVDSGVSKSDAKKLAQIVESENPENENEPFGPKAKKWLVENLKKANDGSWKVGVSVATDVIKKAALKYYGLD